MWIAVRFFASLTECLFFAFRTAEYNVSSAAKIKPTTCASSRFWNVSPTKNIPHAIP